MLRHFYNYPPSLAAILSSLLGVFSLSSVAAESVRIACVGDSVTFGSGIKDRGTMSYPAQLSALLGSDCKVQNFGVSGHTAQTEGNAPYIRNKAYQKSLDFDPDVVILALGVNDTKNQNWQSRERFATDVRAMVESYRALPTEPRVIICLPLKVTKNGRKDTINEKVARTEVAPVLRKVAEETNSELVDWHPLNLSDPNKLTPDGVHPTAEGAGRIAQRLARVVGTPRDDAFHFAVPVASKKADFHGFQLSEFEHAYRLCRIVHPKVAAADKPWILRAHFWGHQPQFDIAMLELGWHVCYYDVGEFLGGPEGVRHWDVFYEFATESGLAATRSYCLRWCLSTQIRKSSNQRQR